MLARAKVALALSSLTLFAACESTAPATDASVGNDGWLALDVGADAGPTGPDFCAEMSIPRFTFSTALGGNQFGDLAGDFTVHELDGTEWRLRDRWTGCESYVFLTSFPGVNDGLFTNSAPDDLFLVGPRNVQYFFLSDAADEATRRDFATRMAALLEDSFDFRSTPAADREFWRTRFHFVVDRATSAGSVGALLTDYITYASSPSSGVDVGGGRGTAYPPAPTVLGIDRAQHWDAGDSLAQSVAATDNSTMGMAAYLPLFYNYRGELEARLTAQASEATIVSLVDETTTLRTFTRTVTLPSASEMASLDTLEIDVVVDCEARNPFACSEWDRIADVQLCLDGEACTDRREVGRWITPYWRRGRQHYLLEASPMLGLLRAGGQATFFVELGPDWERATEWHASVSLRFRSAGGAAPSASGAERAYVGGTFGPDYNTSHGPFTFTPPAGTTRVELVTLLTGHGQDSGNNCAEWCDHRHSFSVNGTALPTIRYDRDEIGSPFGCAQRASLGVIPGQLGNWEQSRAYWCPGMAVQPIRTDITSLVTIGAESTLTYQGSTGASGPPVAGDIDLTTYVVYYR